jgi:hypothetical protein
MTLRAETSPAIFPTKVRYLSPFMASLAWCQRRCVFFHCSSYWDSLETIQ